MDVAATFIAAIGAVVALWGVQRSEFKGVRGEITDLRGEINEFRSEMRGELREFRTEVHSDVRALDQKIDRVFVELLHHVQQGHPHGPPNQAA